MKRIRAVLACLLVASVQPLAVSGQSVSMGGRFESYAFDEADGIRLHSIRLVSVPFQARAALRPWASLSVEGAYADARATLANGQAAEVSGMTDTRLTLDLERGGLTLSASTLVPTGEVATSTEAATVVGLLSTDLMPFAITRWGTGGGVSADVGYRLRPGPIAVEVFVGGSVLAESTVLSSGPRTYQPGRELRVRSAIETGVGDAGVLSVLLGYQRFGNDGFGGEDVFVPGSRFEGVASYAFPLGRRRSALAYGGVYRLGKGELPGPDQAGQPPAGPFTGARESAARTLLVFGAETRWPIGSVDLAPRGNVRLLRNADGVGQGWLASLGARAGLDLLGGLLGGDVTLQPEVQGRFGRLVAAEGVESTMVGLQASMTLRWGGR